MDREKETNGRVQFAVIAQDKDNPPKNSSNIGFVIEIKDINDNTPAFKNPELSFAFPQVSFLHGNQTLLKYLLNFEFIEFCNKVNHAAVKHIQPSKLYGLKRR